MHAWLFVSTDAFVSAIPAAARRSSLCAMMRPRRFGKGAVVKVKQSPVMEVTAAELGLKINLTYTKP